MFGGGYGFYGTRNFTSDTYIADGNIVINESYKKDKYKTIIKVVDKKVVEKKVLKNGSFTFWLKYGEFQKERSNGTTHKIIRYSNKTGKGKDGLCVRKDYKLEGYSGTCYTFFCNGRLLWQKFKYDNNVIGYYARHNHNQVIGIRPDRKALFLIEGSKLNFKGNGEGEPFLYNRLDYNGQKWNLSQTECSYCFYDKRGRIKEKGSFLNKQRSGEWTENYRKYFFINGVKVNKKLFNAPPESIDPQVVLNEPNAQARSMLLKKIGLERVVEKCKGKLIHKDEKGHKLYDFPIKNRLDHYHFQNEYATEEEDRYDNNHLRILQVICTTTKENYFLRVPALPKWNTCESARQGTFNGFDPNAKPINFERET